MIAAISARVMSPFGSSAVLDLPYNRPLSTAALTASAYHAVRSKSRKSVALRVTVFAADADTMLRAGSKPVSTPAEAESELRRAADDPYAFAITLRETGEVMGKIKYQRDYCRYNTDSISIGYELSRRYRHNGYMTEALRAMVQNAFEVMNVEVVAISHFVGNEPSRKVIERAGFIFEGVMPCGFKRFDGEIFDNVCYSILRSEYDTGLISSVRRMR